MLASRASEQLVALLDRTQAAARRWTMNIVGHKVATEFILGLLDWSTFEARKARSKMRYFAWISAMGASRWPRMIVSMIALENISTDAMRRQKFLKEKYGCTDIPLEHWEDLTPKLKRFYNSVSNRMQDKFTDTWKEGMNSKPSPACTKNARKEV